MFSHAMAWRCSKPTTTTRFFFLFFLRLLLVVSNELVPSLQMECMRNRRNLLGQNWMHREVCSFIMHEQAQPNTTTRRCLILGIICIFLKSPIHLNAFTWSSIIRWCLHKMSTSASIVQRQHWIIEQKKKNYIYICSQNINDTQESKHIPIYIHNIHVYEYIFIYTF